jgi:RimJ/RimL family protein N-acetyltransferase
MQDGELVLRPWRRGDEDELSAIGNDIEIWRNLRDVFPHPYRRADAEHWIALAEDEEGVPRHFAITVGGRLAGGIGFDPLEDVYRATAEIGYWLGRAFWGRGLATRALALASRPAFAAFGYQRLQAGVYEWNPGSARVLEKCGYQLEGRMRRAVIKDGRVGDVLLYARLRPES